MSDPEILDPEGSAGPAPANTVTGIERLIAAVQKTLPGQTVRVDVAPPTPGSPVPPRFRLEAAGKGGSIVVESGPLMTAIVGFHGAKLSVFLMPDLDKAAAEIAERVRELAEEDVVVLKEQTSDTLRRVTLVKVKGGRVESVVDSGIEPHQGAKGPPRFHSFHGTWDRAPTKQEKAALDRMQGGLMGKLKRKLLEKIVDKTASSIRGAVEQAGENMRRDLDVDDGRRKLGE